jgi:HK97 family phage portal protein
MVLPPWVFGGNAVTPQITNEMSGLYRPTSTNQDLDRLYATGPAVYTAANIRADNVGAVKWKLRDHAGKEVIHPLAALLEDSNMSDIMRRAEISLCFRGHSLIWKQRGYYTHDITDLRWINFNLYMPDKDIVNGLIGFRVIANTSHSEPIQVDYIQRRDAIYIHGIDLFDDFDGVSPAEVAFMNAGIDIETATTAMAFFQNMAIPALLFQPAADSNTAPTPDEVKSFGDILRRVAKGVLNAGRNVITPNRWDVQELQPNFGDLAMTELSEKAIENIFMAFNVPLELVKPTASNFAQAFEARRAWITTWFMPHCNWLADQLTTQLVRPINREWHVEPDFENVPGQKDDLQRRVEIVNAQVQGGYMDLYTAQVNTDTEPDETLKGLYMVGGMVLPKTALPNYWQQVLQSKQSAAGTAPSEMPVFNNALGTPPPKPMNPQGSPYPTKRLPDSMYKELKAWEHIVSRKGVEYPFAAKALPIDTVDYGRALLEQDGGTPEVFAAIKAHALHVLDRGEAEAYTQYWQEYDALQEAMQSDWLNDYMRVVSPKIQDRITRQRGTISDEEIQTILNKEHAALLEKWVGTLSEPGPLFKVVLAGFAAGNRTLQTGHAANPTAVKSISDGYADVFKFISNYSYNLIRNIDQTTVQDLRDTLTAAIGTGTALPELTEKVNVIFNDPARAKLIAETETIRAYNQGAFSRWQAAGVQQAQWKTVNDGHICPICSRLNNQIANISDGWTDPATGKIYLDIAHPRCRCFRKPILATTTGPEITLPKPDTTPPEPVKPPRKLMPHEMLPPPVYTVPRTPAEIMATHEDEYKEITQKLAAKIKDPDYKKIVKTLKQANKEMSEAYKSAAELEGQAWNEEDPVKQAQLKKQIKELKRTIKDRQSEIETYSRLRYRQEKEHIANTIRGDDPAFNMNHTFNDPRIAKDTQAQQPINDGVAWLTRALNGRTYNINRLNVGVEYSQTGRAHYGNKSIFVGYGNANDTATAIHEIGHALEDADPRIHDQCVQFLESRAEDTSKTYPLSQLIPKGGYAPHEIAYADKFQSAYTGKVYKRADGTYYATEILSMGMEHMYNDPVEFQAKDPEFFNFILGIMKGYLR